MIKVDKGNVVVTGPRPMVLAEFSTLVHVLHYHIFIDKDNMAPEESKKLIMEAVEKGFQTEAETKAMAKESLLDVLSTIKELIEGKDDETWQ